MFAYIAPAVKKQGVYDICAMFVDGGFGRAVATQSSEANLLWVRSSGYQCIRSKRRLR